MYRTDSGVETPFQGIQPVSPLEDLLVLQRGELWYCWYQIPTLNTFIRANVPRERGAFEVHLGTPDPRRSSFT